MDWLTSSSKGSLKPLEFYQRKVLSFLYSAEGRDDFRCLNIPISQLGFFSPLHFISCIPLEMSEPYKNDKLFLASSGDLRRGDKVLLLEQGMEGIIKSAVFKARRMGNNGEPEIQLDGHRKLYTSDEVVPYKAHLRQQLGTALVPEKDFDIREGVLQWEEPSWEPGQEVYYRPEKRWITILSHETNQKGRPVVVIKMDGTNLKKEKVARVSLQDLQENGAPVRIPKRLQHSTSLNLSSNCSSGSSYASSPDDVELPPMVREQSDKEVVEKVYSPPAIRNITPIYAVVDKKSQPVNGKQMTGQRMNGIIKTSPVHKTQTQVGNLNGSPLTPVRRFWEAKKKEAAAEAPPLPSSPPPPRDPPLPRYDPSPKITEAGDSTSSKPIYRNKSTKRSERPATEYYPPPPPPLPQTQRTSNIYQEPEPLKFKSCNNLDLDVSDDDLEPFQLTSYTNSLRCSARKIIQKQLAQEATTRATSLKLKPVANRPHISEIFALDQDKLKMTKLTEPPRSSHTPIYTKPMTPSSVNTVSVYNNTNASSATHRNNLSKSRSQPEIGREDNDPRNTSSSRPELAMIHPFYQQQSQKPNPLDFNFVPLSSSELVKQQIAVANRVLDGNESTRKSVSPEFNSPTPSSNGKGQSNDLTCVLSDSSSHDNDSGRGSYQYISDTIKDYEDRVQEKRQRTPVVETSANNSFVEAGSQPTRNGTIARRYTKNRSSSRSSSLPRHLSSREDREPLEEEQDSVPMPINPACLASASGYGKGIQGANNSSYADATLCALFMCSNIFDLDLLYSKPGQIERGIKKEIRKILREKIVTPIRTSYYCKSDNVTHLREAMLPLSSKMHSPLMDAQEFLYLLFDSALNTESFLQFSNGTKDYMHQIIARPKDRSKSQTVQFMLEASMGSTGIKFNQIPSPALFLCMPRCKGRLVYYEAVVPSLQLNVTRLLQKGPKQCVCEMAATLQCTLCHRKNGEMALDFCEVCKGIADQIHYRLDHNPILVPKSQQDELLNLHSIICTRGNRYVAFVKAVEHRLSPWLFIDSMAGEYPEVTLLEDFGRWLDSLEKQPGHYREFAKLHPLLKRIMTDSHIYIYSKTHLNPDAQNESLVI